MRCVSRCDLFEPLFTFFKIKDNFNILRDTTVLQTQTRQFEGLVETRHNLLRLWPFNRHHLVGLAVAYQLNGNLAEAKEVLESLERFLRVRAFISLFGSPLPMQL